MRRIASLQELKDEIKTNENVWLLLFKKGSEQSDCAFRNFEKAGLNVSAVVLCVADVNEVRDIHPEYQIISVPSLLNFEKGELKNIVKGCHQPEQFSSIFEKVAFVPKSGTVDKPLKTVTVYTTPSCSWCTTLKRHLDVHGIRYREINVAADQKAAEEMVRKSGQQGVPQTDINGQMIVGFDRVRINTLLGIN
ncbi:MAG: NrdH-redoxin [Bacteroidia bacterium]|nr:NrdH-redoxin [Bacteroidia bacterium]